MKHLRNEKDLKKKRKRKRKPKAPKDTISSVEFQEDCEKETGPTQEAAERQM